MSGDLTIMVVDGNFNAVVVVGVALAKRAGALHEHTAAVAQFAVERLDHTHPRFAHDVRGGWQHLRVGPPGIGEGVRSAAVTPSQRGRAARTQHPGHDTPRGPFHGQVLRHLRPTNVHISSNSNASHCFFWALFDCRHGSDGAGCCAFIHPFGNSVARYPR